MSSPCCHAGAQEVVMLDREAIALQCSLLSAQACGLDSVQDYMLHPSPLADTSKQEQQLSKEPPGYNGHEASARESVNPGSRLSSAAQPQVSTLADC